MNKEEKCNLKIKKILCKRHRVLFFLIGKKAEKNLDYALKLITPPEKPLKVLWLVGEENLRSKEKFTQLIKNDNENTIKIHMCSYNNTVSLLGSSYHACIFNSFEFITPNLMARCAETVLRGGAIIFLLNTVNHLQQIATIEMKQHEKYATSWFPRVHTRFNSRFFCSLSHCKSAFAIQKKSITALCDEDKEDTNSCSSSDEGESNMKNKKVSKVERLVKYLSTHKELDSITKLIKCCATLHQVKVLVKFQQMMQSSPCILSLTSDRGRGKSSSLGLLLALAVKKGLSNIMVTAPSLSNVQTLFHFLTVGLDALGFKRNVDYKVEKDEGEMIFEVSVSYQHEQVVQFGEAFRHDLLTKSSLLCIDESASIPLNWVKKLTNARLCIMASTIKGYEGTGRSLSLKLMKDLREKYNTSNSNNNTGIVSSLGGEEVLKASKNKHKSSKIKTSKHIFFDEASEDVDDFGSFDVEDLKNLENAKKMTKFLLSINKNKGVSKQESQLVELQLKEAIRYNDNDPVEIWMDHLFCLTPSQSYSFSTPPQTKACQLFYVNLNALFDSSPTSERLLHSIVSILVESHYKNSPDDLQMLADAPAHNLFCLLPPNTNKLKRKHEDSAHRDINDISYPIDPSNLPDVLCVIQVAFEGNMHKDYYEHNKNSSEKTAGDLMPWLLDHQFPGSKMVFRRMVRIVRIATNSRYIRMGFGKRAVTLLEEFFATTKRSDKGLEKEIFADKNNVSKNSKKNAIDKEVFIGMPFCGVDLDIEYMGASFGCSLSLVRFWQSVGMCPVYLSQAINSSTGEQSCVFIKALKEEKKAKKIKKMNRDFIGRFCHLLPYDFSTLDSRCCVQMIGHTKENFSTLKAELFNSSQDDVKRLKSYMDDVIEWKVVKDLMHNITMCYAVHGALIADDVDKMAILVGVGLQGKSFDNLTIELNEKKEEYRKFSKVDRKNNSKKQLTNCQHYDVHTVVGLMNKAFKEILSVLMDT